MKGALGLVCCPAIGMWGLGPMANLPKELDHYQEAELEHFPVKYNKGGWPVHPETGERTVRALSR